MQVDRLEEDVLGKLYWRGVLTQAMSMDLGGALILALRECDTLIVNLEGVEGLDLSCLVMLCAVKRQANEMEKIIHLDGLENPIVALMLQSYRSNGNRICRAYCGNHCLFESLIQVQ